MPSSETNQLQPQQQPNTTSSIVNTISNAIPSGLAPNLMGMGVAGITNIGSSQMIGRSSGSRHGPYS